MAGNFDGIRQRNFGIEIEMTGLTRCQAAKAIAKVLGGSPNHVGGSYDKYTVEDSAEVISWTEISEITLLC